MYNITRGMIHSLTDSYNHELMREDDVWWWVGTALIPAAFVIDTALLPVTAAWFILRRWLRMPSAQAFWRRWAR